MQNAYNKPDYTHLEAAVAEWLLEHIEHVRNISGEDMAEAAAEELKADPWTVLLWYVEDQRGGRVSKVVTVDAHHPINENANASLRTA